MQCGGVVRSPVGEGAQAGIVWQGCGGCGSGSGLPPSGSP